MIMMLSLGHASLIYDGTQYIRFQIHLPVRVIQVLLQMWKFR